MTPLAGDPSLVGALRETLAQTFGLTVPDDPALAGTAPLLAVAFSGGVDSAVLLDLLSRWWPPSRLVALHVHHHLQAAADEWPVHCERFAAARGVRFAVLHAEGRPAAGDSVEQWARNERYRVLCARVRQAGAQVLLTAHHADDQVETLLLRIGRGTGPRGLAGILPQRLVEGVRVLRPLLNERRRRLLEYAQDRRLEWVEDPSNQDLRLRRNMIRQQVVPALERVSPTFRDSLLESAARSVVQVRVIDELARADVDGAATDTAQGARNEAPATLDRCRLRELPRERGGWALRHWLQTFGVPAPSRAQTDELLRQMLDSDACDAQVVIADVAVLRHRDRLFVLPHAASLRSRIAAARNVEAITFDSLVAYRQLPDGRSGGGAGAISGAHGSGSAHGSSGAGRSSGNPACSQWQISLPAGLGLLLVNLPSTSDARSPVHRVGHLHVTHGQHAGVRIRLHAGRPSRSLKNLYQEAGIPDWLRPLYPLVMRGDELMHSAAFGPASLIDAEPDMSFDWQPAGEASLCTLLRRHQSPRAGSKGPAV